MAESELQSDQSRVFCITHSFPTGAGYAREVLSYLAQVLAERDGMDAALRASQF